MIMKKFKIAIKKSCLTQDYIVIPVLNLAASQNLFKDFLNAILLPPKDNYNKFLGLGINITIYEINNGLNSYI